MASTSTVTRESTTIESASSTVSGGSFTDVTMIATVPVSVPPLPSDIV